MKIAHLLLALSITVSFLVPNLSVAAEPSAQPPINQIQKILQLPEQQIDMAQARLLIEKELYSEIDVEKNLERIDSIISTIRQLPEFGSSSLERMGSALRYFYTPGPWNSYRAYRYDLTDPLGTKKPRGSLISSLMKTGQGNCVSMPVLLTIIGQRLGVNISLSTAPHHLFSRYIDDKGIATNIEATSGTLATDQHYIESLEIHPEAVKNGIYLQTLTNKEAVAFMLYSLGRRYMLEGRYADAQRVADLILKYYPKCVNAMLLKGNIFTMQLREEVDAYRAKNIPPTPAIRKELEEKYVKKNLYWFSRAEALGWRQPGPGFDQKYLQGIERVRAMR
jgi:regulator of sirC expression with transglutaminase-like and TPR domain